MLSLPYYHNQFFLSIQILAISYGKIKSELYYTLIIFTLTYDYFILALILILCDVIGTAVEAFKCIPCNKEQPSSIDMVGYS
jgi:hypothetical protein